MTYLYNLFIIILVLYPLFAIPLIFACMYCIVTDFARTLIIPEIKEVIKKSRYEKACVVVCDKKIQITMYVLSTKIINITFSTKNYTMQSRLVVCSVCLYMRKITSYFLKYLLKIMVRNILLSNPKRYLF